MANRRSSADTAAWVADQRRLQVSEILRKLSKDAEGLRKIGEALLHDAKSLAALVITHEQKLEELTEQLGNMGLAWSGKRNVDGERVRREVRSPTLD